MSMKFVSGNRSASYRVNIFHSGLADLGGECSTLPLLPSPNRVLANQHNDVDVHL